VKKLCNGRNCGRNIEIAKESLDAKRAEGYNVHGNPNVCRRSRYLLTNEESIEVQGPHTSGEVEIVAVMDRGEVLISVGSDHNDRSLESTWTQALGKVFDSAKLKQMAPAVIARNAWKYEDVKGHWDKLNLRSYVTVDDKKIPYQNFDLSSLVDLEYHFRTSPWLRENGVVLFGGSAGILESVPSNVYQYQPSIENVFFPTDFNFEVHDPILNRNISHSYNIITIEGPRSLSL